MLEFRAMAGKSRATFAKRQREIARQERARDKAAKMKERRDGRTPIDRTSEDPDIAGIVPGPQPLPYDIEEEDQEPPKE
jgi:hypothetical protein